MIDNKRLDRNAETLAPSQPAPSEATLPPAGESPSAADQLGSVRYELQEEIGRGGMGSVVRGTDRDIRREVAIKYLLDPSNASKVARFVEEARITGQLEHPNIVPIHELGVDEAGRPFFSMKMVRGRSLADVILALRRDPGVVREWPTSRLVNVLVGVCHGIEYAHSRGVVHRDLKPANVMVGDFGEVYVMDWGLAKPLASEEEGAPSGSGEPVVLTRRDEGLTQEGAIVGTPAYMPPEQALGRLRDIDQRSDVYALGAILYTLLTLEAPVEGDLLAALARVVDGEIPPPHARAPGRAALIPAELSAVAMKALATYRADRYQSVAEFRRDLELYLAGRSVSAKKDTSLELTRKFVRRNRAATGAAAAGLLLTVGVLGASAAVNYQARLRADAARDAAEEQREKAEANYNAFALEQHEKRQRMRSAAPAFIRAARLLANERQFSDALTQARLALDNDPSLAEAHLIQGQLFVVLERYNEAAAALSEYLRHRPDDPAARRLAKLAEAPRTKEAAFYISLCEVFEDQKAFCYVEQMARRIGQLVGPEHEQLKPYRKQVERLLKGAGGLLRYNARAGFTLNLYGKKKVVQLEPLRDIPLRNLRLEGTGVDSPSLAALRGAPLRNLNLKHCRKVASLDPLEGMPLVVLNLDGCPLVDDLRPLRHCPLKNLRLVDCRGLTTIEPLRGMKLVRLDLSGCPAINDLTPLEGMPLQELSLNKLRRVARIDALRGLPLITLRLNDTSCDDLSPLEGMPLQELVLTGCKKLKSLVGVEGLTELTSLACNNSSIADLSPLQGLPLTRLNLSFCHDVTSLDALRGMPLTSLRMLGLPGVDDLRPLEGMELEELAVAPRHIKNGWEVVEKMTSLKAVSPARGVSLEPAEFFKRLKRGDYRK